MGERWCETGDESRGTNPSVWKGGRWEVAGANPATEVAVQIQASGKMEVGGRWCESGNGRRGKNPSVWKGGRWEHGGRTLVRIRGWKSWYESKRLGKDDGGERGGEEGILRLRQAVEI